MEWDFGENEESIRKKKITVKKGLELVENLFISEDDFYRRMCILFRVLKYSFIINTFNLEKGKKLHKTPREIREIFEQAKKDYKYFLHKHRSISKVMSNTTRQGFWKNRSYFELEGIHQIDTEALEQINRDWKIIKKLFRTQNDYIGVRKYEKLKTKKGKKKRKKKHISVINSKDLLRVLNEKYGLEKEKTLTNTQISEIVDICMFYFCYVEREKKPESLEPSDKKLYDLLEKKSEELLKLNPKKYSRLIAKYFNNIGAEKCLCKKEMPDYILCSLFENLVCKLDPKLDLEKLKEEKGGNYLNEGFVRVFGNKVEYKEFYEGLIGKKRIYVVKEKNRISKFHFNVLEKSLSFDHKLRDVEKDMEYNTIETDYFGGVMLKKLLISCNASMEILNEIYTLEGLREKTKRETVKNIKDHLQKNITALEKFHEAIKEHLEICKPGFSYFSYMFVHDICSVFKYRKLYFLEEEVKIKNNKTLHERIKKLKENLEVLQKDLLKKRVGFWSDCSKEERKRIISETKKKVGSNKEPSNSSYKKRRMNELWVFKKRKKAEMSLLEMLEKIKKMEDVCCHRISLFKDSLENPNRYKVPIEMKMTMRFDSEASKKCLKSFKDQNIIERVKKLLEKIKKETVQTEEMKKIIEQVSLVKRELGKIDQELIKKLDESLEKQNKVVEKYNNNRPLGYVEKESSEHEDFLNKRRQAIITELDKLLGLGNDYRRAFEWWNSVFREVINNDKRKNSKDPEFIKLTKEKVKIGTKYLEGKKGRSIVLRAKELFRKVTEFEVPSKYGIKNLQLVYMKMGKFEKQLLKIKEEFRKRVEEINLAIERNSKKTMMCRKRLGVSEVSVKEEKNKVLKIVSFFAQYFQQEGRYFDEEELFDKLMDFPGSEILKIDQEVSKIIGIEKKARTKEFKNIAKKRKEKLLEKISSKEEKGGNKREEGGSFVERTKEKREENKREEEGPGR